VLPQVLLLTSPADFAEARTRLTQDELSITELFRENTPSVVFITNMASRSVHPHLKTSSTTGSSHFDSLLSVLHSMHIVLLHVLFCLNQENKKVNTFQRSYREPPKAAARIFYTLFELAAVHAQARCLYSGHA